MKNILFVLLIASLSSYAGDVEHKIIEIAINEYPDDKKMQEYIYEQQLSAYKYLEAVDDAEVMDIATNEYPSDFSMQKYVYDQ